MFVFLTLVVIAVIIKAPSGFAKRRSRISLHTGLQRSGYIPAQLVGPDHSPLWEEGATNLLHPPVAMVATVGG